MTLRLCYALLIKPSFRLTRKMSSVKIVFSNKLSPSDPHKTPVLIIGQLCNLAKVNYADLRVKLEPRVTEEVFISALSSLHPAPTDTCSLYLNLATLAALPVKSSRHNTPSRAHSITKLVRGATVGVDETILVVCDRQDVFASGCAVARAFSLFSRKSGAPAEPVTVTVEFLVTSGDALTTEDLRCLDAAAQGVRLAARIVDAPCSEMNVSHFLTEVTAVGEELGTPCRVFRGDELLEIGLGGIHGVGRAANTPPALAVLSHIVPGARRTVAWVGKGIVYDTGGLSIKGKTAMPGMKRDCGGAAAVLGAFQLAVSQGFTDNLHAVFCLAENSVGPDATRPDDIHTLYSGKTVEINNTDAEGRLVLADGVCYANKDLKADVILDIATLTGAQGIACGKYHAALLTNDSAWEELAVLAGRASGDLAFPIPYCPDLHFAEFSSAVADMKNSVADRNNAQPSCAGLFINAHLGFDFPGAWIHVDMAYPSYTGERATGYGVALLAVLFGAASKSALLQAASPENAATAVGDCPNKKPKRQ